MENLEIFSPKNFQDYIGQNRAKEIASVMIKAAKIEKRPLPNIIIDGSFGLGKTSLAKIIVKEMGINNPQIVDAQAVDVVSFSPQTVIVDEIHNLDPKMADTLNIEIDKGNIHIVGCTTNPGLLPAPFRSRFRSIHLENYKVPEIQHIATLVSVRRKINLSGPILANIAKRSRLNPRVVINHMAFVFDYMTVNGLTSLTIKDLNRIFDTLGVDSEGFDDRDKHYMAALSEEKPLGLKHISAVTGIDTQTIESEIEPYLLQTRHIERQPRGRIKLKDL